MMHDHNANGCRRVQLLLFAFIRVEKNMNIVVKVVRKIRKK